MTRGRYRLGAVSMSAPIFFVMFGIAFVGLAIVQAIFHSKNAAGTKNILINLIDNINRRMRNKALIHLIIVLTVEIKLLMILISLV